MTSDDWEMLAEAELTHDKTLAAHEVSLLTPRERSAPDCGYCAGVFPCTTHGQDGGPACTCLGTLIPSACERHNPW
jgi:hypothetical protein